MDQQMEQSKKKRATTADKLVKKMEQYDKLQGQMERLKEQSKKLKQEIKELEVKRQQEVMKEFGFASIEELEQFLTQTKGR
ncbi:hypothetical protein [Streptococcus sobrinus]|uniref:hypothetical protein n=1 Tax=Streptococcus sobrinus TaxID=1310 RepID=UPI0002FE600D|nr:hypothetical protein [Streptococcus sobrinus]